MFSLDDVTVVKQRQEVSTHLFPFVQCTRQPAVGQQCSYFLGLAYSWQLPFMLAPLPARSAPRAT